MTLLDFFLEVQTPKLNVPTNLRPTWDGREWLVHPLGENPWWSALLAFGPALLATILIFMDQQISTVIVNRKENKFRVSRHASFIGLVEKVRHVQFHFTAFIKAAI